MSKTLKPSVALAAAVGMVLTGLAGAPSLAQEADVTYVAFGDSLTAGFASGGLSIRQQETSYPALINRQLNGAESTFAQPLFPEPGCGSDGAQLGLTLTPAPDCSPTPATIGGSGNQAGCLGFTALAPFDNLAVPGATLDESINTFASANPFFGLILQGQGTMLQQTVAASPDLISVWIGNNDVLGAALGAADVENLLTPVESFEADFISLMNQLDATGADIVVGTIPDVTAIPFVTFVGPFLGVFDGIPIGFLGIDSEGEERRLRFGDFVTVNAIPIITDPDFDEAIPLPDAVVLDSAEVAIIQERTAEFNEIIEREAARVGAAVARMDEVLADAADEGILIGGAEFTTDFITGGLFSFDGIHLTATGYAVAANVFIEALNDTFGTGLIPVELGEFAFEELGATGSPTPFPLADFPQECLGTPMRTQDFTLRASDAVSMYGVLTDAFPTELIELAETEKPRVPRSGARGNRVESGLRNLEGKGADGRR